MGADPNHPVIVVPDLLKPMVTGGTLDSKSLKGRFTAASQRRSMLWSELSRPRNGEKIGRCYHHESLGGTPKKCLDEI